MSGRSFPLRFAVLGAVLALAACSSAASPSPQAGGGGPPASDSVVAGASQPDSAAGANGFEGTLTSSGTYSATWSVAPGVEADPLNSTNHASLASDHGTFGNIKVELDGSLSFGSGATELSKNGAYTGSGAKVTLDSGGQFVCAFTVDTDLKGSSDGAILHLSGGLTVHWHPIGLGGLNCP